MAWTVIFHTEFDAEFQEMEEGLQDELLAHAKLLQDFGPTLAVRRWTRSRARATLT